VNRRGRQRALVAAIGATVVAVSPAAAAQGPETVAYENGGIAISRPAGAPPQQTRLHWDPALSPDGTRLAWVATAAGRPHVFVGDLDGSHARQVSAEDAYDEAPAWSPDGGRLVYQHLAAGQGATALLVVNADGSHPQEVPGARGLGPLWSPDGRFLAYNDGAGKVLTIGPDGRGRAVLGSGMRVWDWSADGTRLAISRDGDLTGGASGRGAGLFRLGDRTAATVVADTDVDSYTRPVFAPSGQTMYVDDEHFSDKSDFYSQLERRLLDGTRDATFTPQFMSFSGRISAGGGVRAAPIATNPATVGGPTATAAPSTVTLRFTLPTEPATAGVTVRYAASATAPATVEDGIAGGDTLGDGIPVSRLAPSTTYSFSVFTRDWSGAASSSATATVTTPAEIATTLTMTGPGVVTYGGAARLSGRLVREDTGDGVAAADLLLLGHHTGESDVVLSRVTTDNTGRFTTTRVPSEGTRYTVRYAGSGALVAAAAGALVQVRQRVVLTFSPGARVAAHHVASAALTVSPAFPGGHVRVEQRLYDKGVNVLTRLDARSRATVRLDTSRRQAEAFQNVVVTPGARRGYLNDPAFATFVVY
jgi:hypothetical protein